MCVDDVVRLGVKLWKGCKILFNEGVKNEFFGIIAERLSVRHIIEQARWALVGSLSEVVFVCLFVTGIQLKYTGLRIVYVSYSMCSLFFTLALVMGDSSEDRR